MNSNTFTVNEVRVKCVTHVYNIAVINNDNDKNNYYYKILLLKLYTKSRFALSTQLLSSVIMVLSRLLIICTRMQINK